MNNPPYVKSIMFFKSVFKIRILDISKKMLYNLAQLEKGVLWLLQKHLKQN